LTGGILFVKGRYNYGYIVTKGNRSVGIEYINDWWYYLELEK